MNQQDAFERVVALLHEAALDESLWNRTSAQIDRACGSVGNQVVVRDDSSERSGVLFARFCLHGQRHEEAELEYYDRFFAVDEHVPRLWSLSPGRIVHVRELFSEEELKTSVVYGEGMARSHAQNSLKVRLDGPDHSRIFWSVGDPVDTDGWSAAQIEMIARLLPHMRQFFRVRHALVQANALGQSLEALLDNRRIGVIHLDRRGRIEAMNDFALELLREGDGIYADDGRVHARRPAEEGSLQALLRGAIPPFGVPATSGSMPVRRLDGVSPLVLHVSPTESRQSDFRPGRVAAFVNIVDARQRARVDPRRLTSVLGLTPSESEVAVQLAEGMNVREIAAASGRGESTIRWHLKHIFGKLRVARQLDVAQVVLSVGDIPKSTPER